MALRRAAGGPRAVLFDLGGTLVNESDFNTLAEVAQTVGIEADPERLHQSYRRAEKEYDDSWGRIEFPIFWRQVFEGAMDAPVTPERVAAVYQRFSRLPPNHALFSDVGRCLDALDRGRYRLGIVSNSSSEERVRAVLQSVGILDRFSVVVSSGTEAVAKPDPEIFRRAVDRIGVRTPDCAFVGNLANVDARAAQRAGLFGVWLNRHGTGMGDDPPEITSLTELPPLVAERLGAPVK